MPKLGKPSKETSYNRRYKPPQPRMRGLRGRDKQDLTGGASEYGGARVRGIRTKNTKRAGVRRR